MLNETEQGELHWKYETPGRIRSSPTVAGGTVFFGNLRSRVHAVSVSAGRNQWDARLPNGGILTSPAIDKNRVYAVNNFGYFAALDRSTGEEDWSISIDGGYTLGGLNSSPLLYQQTIYVGMHDGKLYAIDAESGEIQWAFQTGSQIETSPIAINGQIFIGSGSELYAISTSDGQEQWVLTEPSDAVRTPTEHEGTLYFAAEDGTVYAVDGTDGTIEWTHGRESKIESTPTVYENSLYIGLARGPSAVACLDTNNGKEQWVSGTGNVFGSPTVAGGTVFFCTSLGDIYAVNLDSEEYEWTFHSESEERMLSSPTVVDGVMFVGSDDGMLYALNAGTDASSDGSRTEDQSFGYHTQVSTLSNQNPSPNEQGNRTDSSTITPGSSTKTTTAGTDSSGPNGDEDGISPWALGAGGSTVALMGYFFGKKALDSDEESEESDTESTIDDTLNLDDPDA
ncbi:PQQ-binding-like beta-propeller repeat protein [Haloarcula salinisoli]|uniref:PQQ-binding-like beta-propeller repeat protein n=1 Tax=Haloarcula salinisoli TaxID=2487746 RepID=A0A8J7YCJ9_9EURY|nr:PQQ-binding-like beta-propeller repeat protein [Halomicroarcula salinisoli]MBX0302917.1 PQQ-binding-like beta-propeller repeat protein [Halomicroarcula salinisoli]